MERWKKRSVELLSSLAFGSEGCPSVVPYYPQKTEVYGYENRSFLRNVPERHGISSKRIYNLLCELEGEMRANIHNLLIMVDGEVIAECSRDGYGINTWHLSHSMSKTVTGMAIGMLVDEGRLTVDTKLCELFPEVKYKDKRFADITVHHLLSMTAGVSFSEAGSVTESNWTECFFNSELKYTPGTKFSYNSMNSYILARIVTEISRTSLCEFLEERLFSPLGITNYFWERGPEGVEKGGWGLYMSAESWAKLGYMFLSGGIYNGHRILSEDWVERSSDTQAVASTAMGDFNYGYQMWVGRSTDEVLFNGMLGQNVWLCPRNNIVAVVLSGNNELFQDSPALSIIRKYLGGEISDELHRRDIKQLAERETHFFDSRRWARPLEKKHGFAYLLGFKSRTPFDDRWNDILGSYSFPKNNVGFLPLIIRGMNNNLDSTLSRVGFDRLEDSLYMLFTESGEDYRIEIGLYGYKESVLDFRGEKYAVKALGEARINAEGVAEYRIEFLYPELPNTRYMTFVLGEGGRIYCALGEAPNNKIADALIDKATDTSSVLGFGMDLLERRFGSGFIQKKLEDTFSPTLVGADESVEGWGDIIAEEERRLAEQSRAVKVILTVVEHFFKESNDSLTNTDTESDGESITAPKPKDRGSFIGDLIGIFRNR
jgi:CubicO group peptidase (beta-lactamase class C family)